MRPRRLRNSIIGWWRAQAVSESLALRALMKAHGTLPTVAQRTLELPTTDELRQLQVNTWRANR